MQVLLSDGAGVTSRQTAMLLHQGRHRVEVLAPAGFVLARCTRHVAAIHRVPPFGGDPWGWLAAARRVYRERGMQVLLPTQEQVAVLSRAAGELADDGVHTVVPPFEALRRVQDKIAADATLDELGIPRPATTVVTDRDELLSVGPLPVYLKQPIGTASKGVHRVEDRAQLPVLADRLGAALAGPGVLVEQAVPGELVMVTSVFDTGRLLAAHAVLRAAAGAQGGASHKRSVAEPALLDMITRLGGGLGWHGALSLDIICGPEGPVVIDVNPRLVEPVNAALAGVDLPELMVCLASGQTTTVLPAGRAGVRTHQLIQAMLASAANGAGRRGVLAEVIQAAFHRGAYRDSTEELTPVAGDPSAAILAAGVSAVLLASPYRWRSLGGGSVGSYALTAASWQKIDDRH